MVNKVLPGTRSFERKFDDFAPRRPELRRKRGFDKNLDGLVHLPAVMVAVAQIGLRLFEMVPYSGEIRSQDDPPFAPVARVAQDTFKTAKENDRILGNGVSLLELCTGQTTTAAAPL